MNTTTRNRWTIKETNLAKQTLKLMNGNQTKAAALLSEKLDRSAASIQVKLCTLAKKHPSLRKKNIAKRVVATSSSVTKEVKNVEIRGNQLIITF
jgi:ribosomal protein L9